MSIEALINQIKTRTKSESRIIQRDFDPDEHAEIVKAIAGDNFIIDDDNRLIINQMLYYFNGHSLEGIDLNKGLLVVGDVGTGKTTLMKIFKQYCFYTNCKNGFNLIGVRQVVNDFQRYGFEGLEKYTHNPKQNQHGVVVKNPINWCFDDLALEGDQAMHYGTKTNPVNELMLDRYEIFIDAKKLTHATSNLAPGAMKDKYYERLTDRFREMFNVIVLDGKSRRK